ncbi:MAG: FHA domain-containing protein, partial [Hyphomicrobiaceae bacterium]
PEQHEAAAEPTTRVVHAGAATLKPTPPLPVPDDVGRTQAVRGKPKVTRSTFHADPVVGWIVVVGGPGLGAFRPIHEGNNTLGRSKGQRIPIDFGDDSISAEEQAYVRYDSVDRSFLFVPNLAKTNIVSINNKKPTGAVPLQAMDVITVGRTQLAFVPFCGEEFDWSELTDIKE